MKGDNLEAALKAMDRLYKNCNLLFEDLVATIKEKIIASKNVELLKEYQTGYWDPRNSQHKGLFVFQSNDRILFAFMLVKTSESQLIDGKGAQYKKVCEQLKVDVLFPLVLVAGMLEPQDLVGFRSADINRRRNWVDNTLLLNVPDDFNISKPNEFAFDRWLTLQQGANLWYCEKATFKIRRLIDINDNQTLDAIAGELISL